MSKEKAIRGKVDNAHHAGRFSAVRREAEAVDAATQWFFEMYGVPLAWALEMSTMDSDLGHKWKSVMEHINDIKPKPETNFDLDA